MKLRSKLRKFEQKKMQPKRKLKINSRFNINVIPEIHDSKTVESKSFGKSISMLADQWNELIDHKHFGDQSIGIEKVKMHLFGNEKEQFFVEPFVRTNVEYDYCHWHEDQEKRENVKNELLRQSSLEVPKWAVKDVLNCYSIEGTEDLSDENFLRRHAKLEINERRRKRWDMQRLRENRMIEKLRKRYMKTDLEEGTRSNQKLPLFYSFFPSPDSAKFIQIADEMPVLAFGESVPLLVEKEFLLPWHNNSNMAMSPTTSFTKTRFFLKN